MVFVFFFFQAEDGIRDLVRSRGLGDVYKRQPLTIVITLIVLSAFGTTINVMVLAGLVIAIGAVVDDLSLIHI